MLKILLLVLTLSQSKEVTERGGLIFEYEGNAQIKTSFSIQDLLTRQLSSKSLKL